jgi:hypothetical protein
MALFIAECLWWLLASLVQCQKPVSFDSFLAPERDKEDNYQPSTTQSLAYQRHRSLMASTGSALRCTAASTA